jgi:hypothetical protein
MLFSLIVGGESVGEFADKNSLFDKRYGKIALLLILT